MMYIRNWITILGYDMRESEWLAAFVFLNFSSRRQGDMKGQAHLLSFVGDICVVAPLLLPWVETSSLPVERLRLAGEITYLIMIIPKNQKLLSHPDVCFCMSLMDR